MLDIIDEFINNNYRPSFSKRNELLFENEEFSWVFKFDSDKVSNDNTLKLTESSFLEKLNYEDLVEVKIISYECLGWRKDITIKDPPISLCKKLYLYISILNTYNKNTVTNNNLGLFYGDDYFFCDTDPNYVFEIYIKDEFFKDIEFYNFCLSKLKIEHSKLIPHNSYWYFYKEKGSLSDNHQLFLLNTNTKVRRLGYLKLIAFFFIVEEKIAASYISKKFEKFTQQYNPQLKLYKNNKGLIQETRTGISAQPYILLAKELGFLNLINNIYTIGKQFKVYLELTEEIKIENDNVFVLSKLDKLFFLETILSNDYLYISSLVELIFVKRETNYSELLVTFHKFLIRKLDEFISRLVLYNDHKSARKIRIISERIKKWEKPKVYLEHVLMPRLNWLLDLDLIEMDDDLNVKITSQGENFFSHLCYWNDINYEKIINPKKYLETFIIRLFNNTYYNDEGKNKEVKIDSLYSRIDFFLEKSFDKFRTLAPNRVTASQAITYTRYKLYFDDNVVVSSSFIEGYLNNKDQKKFIYKFQKQYNDGYIQMRR